MLTRTRTALALLAAFPAVAAAQELVAGWEGSSSRGYLFASPRISLPLGGGGGTAVDLRAAASHLYYQLDEAGGTTLVRSPGAAAAAGLRWSRSTISAAAGAGFERRWTTRRPPSGVEERRAELGFTGHAEVFAGTGSRTTAFALAAYGHANRYVWARAGLFHRVAQPRALTIRLGPELTAQGNDDVTAWQLGGSVSLELTAARLSLQARAGGAWLRHAGGLTESRPYFGVGLWRAFQVAQRAGLVERPE